MKEVNVLKMLCQASLSEVSQGIREQMRLTVRESFISLMLAEAEELCGGFYHPNKSGGYSRGGSAPGIFTLNGCKESIARPRVRKSTGGKSKEVELITYKAGKRSDEIQELIVRALSAGVSSNEVGKLIPGNAASSSHVSRLWVKEGLARLDELRSRDLSGEDFFCLMLDGIRLGEDVTAVAALGITTSGRKMMLDFEIGSTENKGICDSLLNRLKRRGFKEHPERRMLIVIDGGKALYSSSIEHFDDPVIQRCVIHKERNIKSYLSDRHNGEISRLFSRLRKAEAAEAGREALKKLRDYLTKVSKSAVASLDECGEQLIALHSIGAPSTLNKTLLNTNCIENAFNNVRRKIGRVKRWRAETDQPDRWMAFGMLEAEKGFRRVSGYSDIGLLLDKLKRR